MLGQTSSDLPPFLYIPLARSGGPERDEVAAAARGVEAHVDVGVERGPEQRGGHDLGGRAGGDDAAGAEEDDVVATRAAASRSCIATTQARPSRRARSASRSYSSSRWRTSRKAPARRASRTWGCCGEGAGDGDATLLAAAQGVDGPAARRTRGRSARCASSTAAPVLRSLPHPPALVRRPPHRDHLPHAEPRRRKLALGNEGDRPRRGAAGPSPATSFPPRRTLPACRHEQPRRHAQQRRLPRPVRVRGAPRPRLPARPAPRPRGPGGCRAPRTAP